MIKSVRGFKDILPEETPFWNYLESLARETLKLYGFEEIRIPVLERTELFARSIGESTDIVEKEMYTFLDKGGESVTLRPEATAGIVRAFVEHGLYNRPKPVKLFTMGPMFRYERPQKGRLRQFHQVDVEVFGSPSPALDAELVSLAWNLLGRAGAKGLTVEVNSLGCPSCRPSYRDALKRFLSERLEELCEDCRRRAERNPLRALDCKNERCRSVYRNAPSITNYLCKECSDHFEEFLKFLSRLKVPHEANPNLVRGLDYYTRTTFEIKAEGLGAQDTVCAGGRYDELVKYLGGPPTPAVGFAIGMERWLLCATGLTLHREPPEVFVAAIGREALAEGLLLANELRKKGVKTEVSYEEKSLKALLRHADRLGSKTVLILGEDELKKKTALLKFMDTGQQEELNFSDLKDLANRVVLSLRF